MTCALLRATVLERGDPAASLAAEARAHVDGCAPCRSWLATFAGGAALTPPESLAFTAAVLARTSGPACGRARELAGGHGEGTLDRIDEMLVAEHLEHCPDCTELVAVLDDLPAKLPLLASLDPGPRFTEQVLARTSRRPARASVGTWWRDVCGRLLRRPRLAWEVAYVASFCWFVLLGPSVSALEGPATRLTAAARRHGPATAAALGVAAGDWGEVIETELGEAGVAVDRHAGTWGAATSARVRATVEWTQRLRAACIARLESETRAAAAWLRSLLRKPSAGPTEPPPLAERLLLRSLPSRAAPSNGNTSRSQT